MSQRKDETRDAFLAREAAYRATPERVAYMAAYRANPENREREAAYRREHDHGFQRTPEFRAYRIAVKTGDLTDSLRQLQHAAGYALGTCALCPAPDCFFDHCPTTGILRGLVCNVCNTRLGVLERTGIGYPNGWTDRAAAYLANPPLAGVFPPWEDT